MHSSVTLVGREAPTKPGEQGRRFVEVKSGEFRSADGTWAKILQVVNRRTNRYTKRVELADGEVTRDEDVPLTEHRGHGSAEDRP